MDRNAMYWRDDVSQDDMCVARTMLDLCKRRLTGKVYEDLLADIDAAEKVVKSRTAWRVEGTLREFPKFPPVRMWFDYPRHRLDETGVLKDLEAEGEGPAWKRNAAKAEKKKSDKRRNKKQEFEDAVQNCNMGEPPTIKDLSEWFSSAGQNVADRTIREWVKKFGFCIDKNSGRVVRAEQ